MGRGFTLIEVIVSVALIGTIFVIFGTSLVSVHSQRYADNENIAYAIAEAEIEHIRTMPFASSTNRTESSFVGVAPSHGAWNLLNQGLGLLTIENWNGNTNIKQITAKVQWVDNRGTRSVQIQTLLSEY